MPEQRINLGQNPNDGTGDNLRAAGAKINADFDELYGRLLVAAPLITRPLTLTQDGQTVIPIPVLPTDLSDVGLLVNGIEYRAPDISAAPFAITWNGLFTLLQTYAVFARYR